MNRAMSPSFALRLTLLITAVSGLAAGLVCAALLLFHTQRILGEAAETAIAHAQVIAANSTAALDFEDPEAARQTLAGLGAVGAFAVAEITRPDGRLFARYDRDAPPPSPPSTRADNPGSGAAEGGEMSTEAAEEMGALPRYERVQIQGRWLTAPQPIIRGDEVIGHVTILYDLAGVRQRLFQDIALASVMTLAVILLAFVAARRLQHSLLKPVHELSRVAETIAATEDYAIRAERFSSDELGVLTDVFNTMVGRIGEAESLRRNHQSMLEREVAERTAEILDAQARLRQAERLASLGTLSAGLGHDIGNLLMPLRSHLASIRDRVQPETDETEHDFTAITQATEYLQNLSSGLRLLARDPDDASFRREATKLSTWWTSIEPLLKAMVGRSVALEHDLPADLPRVKLSESLLMQSVFNLVQNAVHVLTPEGEPPRLGARIEVFARLVGAGGKEATIELAVRDNGPGMTSEVLERCIEPYFTTQTRRISSGLGLSLVKGIVESAGGELRIQSQPGKGSTFTMVLLAERPAHQPVRVPAFVTIEDSRRRAIVSHLLRALNCEIQAGSACQVEGQSIVNGGIWLTDNLGSVPASWRGQVVVLGERPAKHAPVSDRITILDPSTPLPRLRGVLKDLLAGAS